MKRIYTGAEGAGKNYMLAIEALRIVRRNARWQKRTGVPRPIVASTDCAFSDEFFEYARKRGVEVKYFFNILDLPKLEDCDLFIGELGVPFDSRKFADLPEEVRYWVAQAEKLGVDIYGAAQDFAQVDLAFRRLVKNNNGGLFYVKKVFGNRRPAKSKPRVRMIWGLGLKFRLDPDGYDEQKKKFAPTSYFPIPFVFEKRITRVFDTSKRIELMRDVPLKHIVRRCEKSGCNLESYEVIHGVRHRVVHA